MFRNNFQTAILRNRIILFLPILLLVNFFIYGQTHYDSNYRTTIMGTWVSETDGKYQVIFTKTNKLDYYSNILVSTEHYWIRNDSLIVNSDPQNRMFYLISQVNSENLVMTFLKDRSIIKLRKIKSN